MHVWVIKSVQLSSSVTHQRETHSHSGQLDEPLSHTSLFQKQMEHIMKRFTPSLVLPISYQTWKNVQPQTRYGCHSHLSTLAQLSTTLKTKGDPRERQQTKTLFIESAILFVQRIFLLLSHFISYYSYDVWQGKYVYLSLQMRKDRFHL